MLCNFLPLEDVWWYSATAGAVLSITLNLYILHVPVFAARFKVAFFRQLCEGTDGLTKLGSAGTKREVLKRRGPLKLFHE